MSQAPEQLPVFASALIAAMVIYPFLTEFAFASPILTVAGEHGAIEVDLNRLCNRSITESKVHVATWYCQQRMGFV